MKVCTTNIYMLRDISHQKMNISILDSDSALLLLTLAKLVARINAQIVNILSTILFIPVINYYPHLTKAAFNF